MRRKPDVSSENHISTSAIALFDSSSARLSRLFSKPNWSLGWYLWLRLVLLLLPINIALLYFGGHAKAIGAKPAGASLDWAVNLVLVLAGFSALGITHHCIRAWARNRYNLALSGFLWWSFFWRMVLVYGLIFTAALLVFVAVALSWLTVSVIMHLLSPGGLGTRIIGSSAWGLGGTFGIFGIAAFFVLVINIPAYGMVAHWVISTYSSRPKLPHKGLRVLLRFVGCLTLIFGSYVLVSLIKDSSAHGSWLKLLRLAIVSATALATGIGLLKVKIWGRQTGILLLIYLLVRWTYWFAEKGVLPILPEVIVMGLLVLPLSTLLLPAVRKVFQNDTEFRGKEIHE